MNETDMQHSALIAELQALKNLDRALRHLEKEKFPLHQMDVVAQDEFSHDVLLPFVNPPDVLVLSVT
jgi:hypothetical protein